MANAVSLRFEGNAVVQVQNHEFPDHLLYDVENQIWYEPLADGVLRVGFTAWAAALMGEILIFTPKRIGHSFERERWFAMVEGGKWAGAARAAFNGIVVAQNDRLIDKPELLLEDAFGEGWMLIVRPTHDGWRDGLIAGADVGPAIERWISRGSYKGRSG
jgi:glycine cleavage system H protein